MPEDKGMPIHIRMRQHIGWRIPIMLLDELDAVRGKRKRTECVVEALEAWLKKQKRIRGEAESEMHKARAIARRNGRHP